jgi:hypothetical protein
VGNYWRSKMASQSPGVSRVVPGAGLFVSLTALHGAALVVWPTLPLIAIGLWWNSNTISHNFIHRPFFRTRALNFLFSAFLTMLLGIPQRLWRDRHLAHHADVSWRPSYSFQLAAESLLLCGLWSLLVLNDPQFFLEVYLPGWCLGLVLCAMQGHYEHAYDTTSHYGRLYNSLCFNDGYHVEHHARPGVHWTVLPRCSVDTARSSRWPPLLRWIDDLRLPNPANLSNLVNRANLPNLVNLVNPVNLVSLELLERLVLRSTLLQRFVLHCHRGALATLLSRLPPLHRIAIVGGGLFPRTALLLQELVPGAELVVIDASAENLATARARLGSDVRLVRERIAVTDAGLRDFDLVLIPLAFQGDRNAIYRCPPSRALLVHDWIWRPQSETAIVSLLLLKRLNLVRG